MVTWKNVGFYVIIYLAGLQYIPRSCQEAIELEGATSWQRFRHLTLPLLLPQTILVVTLSTINGFQLFIEPYVMTGGGPLRRTYSIVLYLYNNAFSYQKMGYAATIGVALALIIGAVVVHPAAPDRRSGGGMMTKASKRVASTRCSPLAALTFIYPVPLDGVDARSSRRPRSARSRSCPTSATFDNYRTMWARAPFGRALLNSIFVATTITIVGARLRLDHRLRDGAPPTSAGGGCSTPSRSRVLLVPGQLTLIPLYTLIVQLGWIDIVRGAHRALPVQRHRRS